jgi:hypothetical protein
LATQIPDSLKTHVSHGNREEAKARDFSALAAVKPGLSGVIRAASYPKKGLKEKP